MRKTTCGTERSVVMSVIPITAAIEAPEVKSSDLSALKFLARRGAGASTSEAGEQSLVTFHAQGARGDLEDLQFAAEDWLRWVSAGWVVPDEKTGVNERWRLANAGRLHLKRLLSRSPETTVEKASVVKSELTSTIEISRPLTQNDAESPLAWLRRRKDSTGKPFLADAEFLAGERLRSDFWFAKMTPRITANWSPVSAGRTRNHSGGSNREADQRDAISDAAERVRAALKAVGPELSGILIDVCCHLKGMEKVEKGENWPQRAGRVVLQHALRALARHYGLAQYSEAPDVFADDA